MIFSKRVSSALIVLSLHSASNAKMSCYGRTSEYAIEPIFLKRQSKYDLHRTLSAKGMKEKLNQLFSAFIWAPSSFNNQPGRIVYAVYGTKAWNPLYDLLDPFNKKWAKKAGALMIVASDKYYQKTGKPCRSHSFDTGLAVENLLLQAAALDLIAHPIEGFDMAKARQRFKIPQRYSLETMIAIGEPAAKACSNKEFAKRDAAPVQRKKVVEFASEGTWRF